MIRYCPTGGFARVAAVVAFCSGCVVHPVVQMPPAAGTFVDVTSHTPIDVYRPIQFSSAPTSCRTRKLGGTVVRVVGDTVTLSVANRVISADPGAACRGIKEASFVARRDVMRMTTPRLSPKRLLLGTFLTATAVYASFAIAMSGVK
jgi:hypothetical protein